MNQQNTLDFLTKKVSTLSGVGNKIKKLLRKKRLKRYQICYGIFR